jgi:hypothetical protein
VAVAAGAGGAALCQARGACRSAGAAVAETPEAAPPAPVVVAQATATTHEASPPTTLAAARPAARALRGAGRTRGSGARTATVTARGRRRRAARRGTGSAAGRRRARASPGAEPAAPTTSPPSRPVLAAARATPPPAAAPEPPRAPAAEEPIVRRVFGIPAGAPRLRVSFLVYSSAAERRSVVLTIDGGSLTTLREGDESNGVAVVRIHPDRVDLRWQGETFTLEVRS